MRIEQIKKRLEEKLNLVFDYVEGDDTEFGDPYCLRVIGRNTLEIASKVGSSWYFSGCGGIELFTVGLKHKPDSKWFFGNTLKLIDPEYDNDILIEWIVKVIKSGYEINNEYLEKRDNLVDFLKTKLKTHKFYKPKAQYTVIRNEDTIEDCFVFEVDIMEDSHYKRSLIFQVGEKIKYCKRVLTSEKYPSLVELSEEKEVEEDKLKELIRNAGNNWKDI